VSDERVIIRHADGREYSVTPEVHAALYPDFEEIGPETPASFVVSGIPKPKRDRKKPAAKNAAPIAQPEPVAEPVVEPEPESDPA
jgi:hypothetical protein